jgi:hypothetical protein
MRVFAQSAFGTAAFTLALMLGAAAPAFAQSSPDSLTLKDAAKAPAATIIDSAAWHCQAGACAASGGASQPALRACKRVVVHLGAVTAFTWQGTALTADQLAACNAGAKG